MSESTRGDEERTVLVTGAAGAIGTATVDAFLRAGHGVVGFDRRPSELTDDRYRHILVELIDERDVEAALVAGLGGGPLTHLIGIAGGALPDEPPTQDDPGSMDPSTFRASLEANLTTQFIVMRACLGRLEASTAPDKSITFTSSFNAFSAQGMPAYSAAKAGLVGLMYGLVRPLGERGIRVNVVAPGTVRTPRTEALWADDEGHFERLERETALGRLALPTDIADAFVALGLTLRHVTGQVLVVDGGQTVMHGPPRSRAAPA